MVGPDRDRGRRRRSASALAAAVLCLALGGTAGASAATVTIGPNLTGLSSGAAYTCGVAGGCTFSQGAPSYASPVSGTIVRWRVIASTGSFTLRVLDGQTGVATGPTATATSKSIQEFPANVPIKAGQQVGLDLPSAGSSLAYLNLAGTSIGYWNPALASGETRAPKSVTNGFQLLFNADVQPPPGITGLGPGVGPIGRANAVTISGHDFTGASSVAFGALPATSFNVLSDTQIAAVAPPSSTIASVPVSVTTVAGTATSPGRYAYQGCKVPKLRGHRLKASKKQLRAQDCRVGKLTKRKGATAKTGKVVKQVPKPGTVAAPGTKVKLTIKP